MTKDNTEGNAVAERVRAADISINGSSSVEAMLANALKERKPLADDGKLHDTIQEAENAASAFVFVPPGNFSDADVNITTEGLTLLGSGPSTRLVNPNAGDTIQINAKHVNVENMTVGGSSYAVNESNSGGYATVKNVRAVKADTQGIRLDNNVPGGKVVNCYASVSGTGMLVMGTTPCIVSGNRVVDCGGSGISPDTRDIITAHNIVHNSGINGISMGGNNQICIGNRVSSSGDRGITCLNNTDCIIANNRVSDSTNSDIDNNDASTTIEGNLTGSTN